MTQPIGTSPRFAAFSASAKASDRGSDIGADGGVCFMLPRHERERGRMVKETPKESAFEGERIAKAIARAGLCSRRDAERLIAEGRVKLNGKVLTSPAVNVKPSD